jgi:hypothetical protein
MSEGKPLVEDKQHARACHERWLKRVNRDLSSPSYKDEWWAEQCLFCRYYIPVVGALAEDWGVCSNQASPFDGIARFEHDGCDHFSEADEQWTASGDEAAQAQELWDEHVREQLSEQRGPLPDV